MIRIVYTLRWSHKNCKVFSVVFLLSIFFFSIDLSARAIGLDDRLNYVPTEVMSQDPSEDDISILIEPPQKETALPSTVSPVINVNPSILPVTTVPVNSSAVISPQQTLATLSTVKPSPVTSKYQQRYSALKASWKSSLKGSVSDAAATYPLFFQQDDALGDEKDTNTSPAALSSGELTEKAVQALMFRFLSDTPSIDLQNMEQINVIPVVLSADAPQINDIFIKTILLDPAQDAFKHGKNIYASIVKIGTGNNEKYIVVAVEKNGKVHLIDPSAQHKSYYTLLLQKVIESLNRQKASDTSIEFSQGSDAIVYTGIQGGDVAATNSGIYAFAYWAGLMNTDNLAAYQSINGAESEEIRHLVSYDSIKVASVYSKQKRDFVPPIDRDNNPFEEEIREWLRLELDGLGGI